MKSRALGFIFVAIGCGIFPQPLCAQRAPAIERQKTMGGTYFDAAVSIAATLDGGFIMACETNSDDGDVTGNPSIPGENSHAWIIKLDSDRNIEWQHIYFSDSAGFLGENLNSITQTSDGGYIFDGWYYHSNDRAVGWIVKLSAKGAVEWQREIECTPRNAHSIIQAADGGYLIVGSGDIAGAKAHPSGVLVKLNSTGGILWQKAYGDSSDYYYYVFALTKTGDGGYLLAGRANFSINGDAWFVKVDSEGILLWQKKYGGTQDDGVLSVIQTSDGGFAAAGYASSNDGDVKHHDSTNYQDVWVLKLNSEGQIVWERAYGGTLAESASMIIQTHDGGYVFIGSTNSNDGDVSGHHVPLFDPHRVDNVWVVKLNPVGAIEWQKCLGGTGGDDGTSILQSPDGGFVISAWAGSNGGDVVGNHGSIDAWVVKLAPESSGVAEPTCCDSSLSALSVSDNPLHEATTLHFAITDAEYVRVEVFDVLGNAARTIAHDGAAPRDPSALYSAGEHSLPISLAGLPSGTYYLRLTLGTGEVRTMKLVKE